MTACFYMVDEREVLPRFAGVGDAKEIRELQVELLPIAPPDGRGVLVGVDAPAFADVLPQGRGSRFIHHVKVGRHDDPVALKRFEVTPGDDAEGNVIVDQGFASAD